MNTLCNLVWSLPFSFIAHCFVPVFHHRCSLHHRFHFVTTNSFSLSLCSRQVFLPLRFDISSMVHINFDAPLKCTCKREHWHEQMNTLKSRPIKLPPDFTRKVFASKREKLSTEEMIRAMNLKLS